MTEIETLKADLLRSVEGASDLAALEAVRLDALGKKGRISLQLKTLGSLEPEQRKKLAKP
jgi:phenylalanyl-tRNA synthetase alpha chain